MLRSEKILHFLIIIFITSSTICNTKEIPIRQCDELRSCGNIHNISYPFRLKGQPEECGEPKYELVCENNRTMLNLQSVKLFVQSINPQNLTILLVDAAVQTDNFSSVPHNKIIPMRPRKYNPSPVFLGDMLLSNYNLNHDIIFISCEKPLSNHSMFVDTKPFINGSVHGDGRRFSYVVNMDVKFSDLGESCSIDLMALSAKPNSCGSNCTYPEIHDLIAYGFELSWDTIYCPKYCKELCRLKEGGDVISIGYTPCGLDCEIFQTVVSLLTHWIMPFLASRFVIGIVVFLIFLIYKWHRRHLSIYDSIEEFLQTQNNLRPIKYSFSDIKKMSKGFKDKLGEGGFGSVYKGRLRSGRDVAIKVLLGKSKANGQDFINEVATIGRIHHVNVVRLIGFSAERSKRALVYEFMPNGSLEKHIFPREGKPSLGYEKMFEISLGVARGIEYLHRGCDMRILHFDIKPHNVLLDENFVPKVSDFGLAKLYPIDGTITTLTAVRGTIGYIAPELLYRNIGNVSHKSDVYSFGMLLLEMTGKSRRLDSNGENSSQVYFPDWIYDQMSKGKSLEIEDVIKEHVTKLVNKMVIVGLWCIQTRPNDRPSMNKVIEMLESEIESLEMPPKPSLDVEEEEETNPKFSSVLSGDSTESSSLVLNVV